MPTLETEELTRFVARVFRIEDVTSGDPQKGFLVRYRGQLVDGNSAELYDRLADSLAPHNIIPLFKIEDGRQAIYLAPKPAEPKKDRVSTNVILFALTVFSVMLAGVEVPAELCNEATQAILYMLKEFPDRLALCAQYVGNFAYTRTWPLFYEPAP